MTDSKYPIRIAYLIDNLSIAGTEQWLLRLISSLDRSKFSPFLCLLDGEGPGSYSLLPRDVPSLRLGVKSLGSLAALTAARRFVKFLKAERIGVVQLHFPDSTYFGAPLAWWAGVPKIIGTARNAGYWATPTDRLRCRWTARFLTDVLANSPASLDATMALFPSKSLRSGIIPNGVDLKRFHDLPPLRLEKPRNDTWKVGIVANLRPVKDLSTFIHAAMEVHKSVPDVEFLIVGEGPERSTLEALITKLGLETKVHLLGAVTDVPQFLGCLDVAALCSKTEGFSNALIEYLAAGRPVVATAVGGNVDLIESGVDGILCNSGDSIEIANSIISLLRDRDLARRLAKSGISKCESRFSIRRELEEYTEFVAALTPI